MIIELRVQNKRKKRESTFGIGKASKGQERGEKTKAKVSKIYNWWSMQANVYLRIGFKTNFRMQCAQCTALSGGFHRERFSANNVLTENFSLKIDTRPNNCRARNANDTERTIEMVWRLKTPGRCFITHEQLKSALPLYSWRYTMNFNEAGTLNITK